MDVQELCSLVRAQTADQARRWAHDVTQAHSLCILLNTEKACTLLRAYRRCLADTAASTQGIDADALSDAAARCAEAWEGEPEVAKRTASACASYLWRVHGVDYFAGAFASTQTLWCPGCADAFAAMQALSCQPAITVRGYRVRRPRLQRTQGPVPRGRLLWTRRGSAASLVAMVLRRCLRPMRWRLPWRPS